MSVPTKRATRPAGAAARGGGTGAAATAVAALSKPFRPSDFKGDWKLVAKVEFEYMKKKGGIRANILPLDPLRGKKFYMVSGPCRIGTGLSIQYSKPGDPQQWQMASINATIQQDNRDMIECGRNLLPWVESEVKSRWTSEILPMLSPDHPWREFSTVADWGKPVYFKWPPKYPFYSVVVKDKDPNKPGAGGGSAASAPAPAVALPDDGPDDEHKGGEDAADDELEQAALGGFTADERNPNKVCYNSIQLSLPKPAEIDKHATSPFQFVNSDYKTSEWRRTVGVWEDSKTPPKDAALTVKHITMCIGALVFMPGDTKGRGPQWDCTAVNCIGLKRAMRERANADQVDTTGLDDEPEPASSPTSERAPAPRSGRR